MRWNDHHQRPIQYWSWDIIKSMRRLMRQPAYAKHLIFAPQRCLNSDGPPKRIYTKTHTADWCWETQERRDTRGWECDNQCSVTAQSGRYTGSHNRHVQWKTSVEFCGEHRSVACVSDNSQPIFEDSPDALKQHHRNGRSPTDSNQER